MKVTEELKKQVEENEVIVLSENVKEDDSVEVVVDDGEDSENYEYGEEEIEYEEGVGGEGARGDDVDEDDDDDDSDDYVDEDDVDDDNDDYVDEDDDDDDDDDDYEDDDDYDDEDEDDEEEEEEEEQQPPQQQQPQPQPEQQARVPPVYDRFMLSCLNFIQDICNTLQIPIPASFDQSSDMWAAAQRHRELHPPQLYEQFDGNWERFQQFQQEQLTKFQERQLQMRQLFIQQYQVAVEQQQFPAAPRQQHDEFSDNMFEAVVYDQQHHQDQD